MKKKLISAVDIIIFILIIVYIFDKYILMNVNSDFGSLDASVETGNAILDNVVLYGLGLCGGYLYGLLGCANEWLTNLWLWQPVTYAFVHLFLIHLLVNIVGLYFAGHLVEKRFGTKTFLTYFFSISILTLFLLQVIMLPLGVSSVSGGASSAIFGMIGISTVIYFRERSFFRNTIKQSSLIYLILYAVFTTYLTGSVWTMLAHNIGFVLGILTAIFLYRCQKPESV